MPQPIPTADVVALTPGDNGDGYVLLIRRGWPPYPDHWALPGGHVDPGEASPTAACRELREETGLSVPVQNLTRIGTYDAPGRDPRGPYTTEAYTTMLVEAAEVVGADDATEARWIPLADLNDLPVAFDHRQIINDAL